MRQQNLKEFPTFGFTGGASAERVGVILAGGEGSRLKKLTRLIGGDERPKQFCPVIGTTTLLGKTRSRIELGIAPENIYFSLTRKHEKYFRPELVGVKRGRMVVQPKGKGTAPAILYSLLRVAVESPDATVAFFPSDHYFSNDRAFMSYVDAAFRAVDREPENVVLLGIEADKAETSYGWIEPESSMFNEVQGSVSRVKRFWEKPDAATAAQLFNEGFMWNSFVMVGRVDAFLNMFRRHLPRLFRMFTAASIEFGKRGEEAAVRSVYSWIIETNFSSEVLEKSADQLKVLRVGAVGWSDWGEPERVIGTLNGLGMRPQWMQAMAA